MRNNYRNGPYFHLRRIPLPLVKFHPIFMTFSQIAWLESRLRCSVTKVCVYVVTNVEYLYTTQVARLPNRVIFDCSAQQIFAVVVIPVPGTDGRQPPSDYEIATR